MTFNAIKNRVITHYSIRAEKLYNRYCLVVVDLGQPDWLVDTILKEYYETLDILRAWDIGGVIINGIFRDLSSDVSKDNEVKHIPKDRVLDILEVIE